MRSTWLYPNNLPSGSDCESDSCFWLNEEVSFSLCLSLGFDEIVLVILIFLVVLLSGSSDGLSFFSSLLSLLVSSILEILQKFGVSGLLLLHVFRYNSI